MRHFAGRYPALPVALTFCIAGLAQTPDGLRTRVKPQPNEDLLNSCEYRLVLPQSSTPIKAVWAIFDRGLDYLQWFEDRQIRAFASEHQLALMLAMHCPSKQRADMNVVPEKGIGRALFTALEQFAVSAGRPELNSVSVIAMGWSGAGSLVGRLAGYRPERYLAGIAYAPGQYEPLGMDTIELSTRAIGSPQLIIANGGDSINGTERPYAYFKKYFDRGAPWTFVVQNRTPHCCLQNAQPLILDWLHAVLTAERKTRGAGEYGYLKVEFSGPFDDWNRPVFNATASRVGRKDAIRPGELPAGWMPSAEFAEQWVVFVGRSAPIATWKP